MPRKNRVVRLSDEEWAEIERVSKLVNQTKAGFIQQVSAHRLPTLISSRDALQFIADNQPSDKDDKKFA